MASETPCDLRVRTARNQHAGQEGLGQELAMRPEQVLTYEADFNVFLQLPTETGVQIKVLGNEVIRLGGRGQRAGAREMDIRVESDAFRNIEEMLQEELIS